MKLMKRILAIVCTFVMIISMATGVNAVNDTSTIATSEKGKITITNANVGETYKIYKILTLESYDKDKQIYSYTRNSAGDPWNGFIETNEAKEFLDVNADGYVTVKNVADSMAAARRFALYGLSYAKAHSIASTKQATANKESKDSTNTTVLTFDNLELGYYLVESSVGTACSITTTNPTAEIEDKHGHPYVKKIITEGGSITENYRKNTINYGEVVGYETTIHLEPNTQNFVLHDKMDSNLIFMGTIQQVHVVKKDGTSGTDENLQYGKDYELIQNCDDGCTFEIKFLQQFYQKFSSLIASGDVTDIVITYGAVVSDDAPINKAMKNETYLKYGQNSKTDTSFTETFTCGIPVFKYTGVDTPLAGAKFNLLDDEGNAIKFSKNGEDYKYDVNGNVELESSTKGLINIKGLEQGTYYLKETEAPKGYNLLKTPVTVVVTADGKIKVNDEIVEKVKVQNNTGSILPSTGGMGTTLIYVVGSILVLASGIVLFSKRKEGTN